MIIGSFTRHGYINHQTLSFGAYGRFIDDDFLSGARIDPLTDGRPDPRLDVKENEKILSNLTNDFNFNQSPGLEAILPVNAKTTSKGTLLG
ncbi:MAG: hypothetical protein HKL80_08175 [Acidimicrobiales bacterium]|nr:hypothetical protein [Acidimicrobiales bacterium]